MEDDKIDAQEKAKRLGTTRETLRRLFLLSGNQCAYPGCAQPLILPDGTFVGEVCHICAAAPGGERFNANQTNEERRAFENLLLLCAAHHKVTNNVASFSDHDMRVMKANHEERFARGLAALCADGIIEIVNSEVSLGGQGGTNGGGGGGGGAIGPNARGGSGGGGGSQNAALLAVKEGEVFRITIGEPAEGGKHGEPGNHGSDVVLERVRPDGTIEEVLRAKGGRGGGLPLLTNLFLANSAEVRDGLIYTLGGGWTRYVLSNKAEALLGSIVWTLDNKDEYAVSIGTTLTRPTGEVAFAAETRSNGAPTMCVAIPFILNPCELGTWTVALTCGGNELGRVAFEVVVAEPAQ